MGTAANVLVGAVSSVKIGAYVTAKGAATLSDVGFTTKPLTFDPKSEFFLFSPEQNLGNVIAVPKMRDVEIKIELAEATIANLTTALAQPTTNQTGTAPNQTLAFDASAAALYYQLQFVGPGLGTGLTRTVTCWKAYVKDMGSWAFSKEGAQILPLTLGLCEETTGSTASPSSFCKIVES